ncbi:hypothetical protein MEX01_21160 [Methylorubrum extorquens]|uniref:ribosome modulation factor n=1 Tax=Methylorubrum extorquens TaxID=408 RepID=UPI00116FBB33|nr:Rmf/CrpP family protein [Methylorubrum extorquens]GEL41525.1 hypothetical protein MEX01_21160 [Methylorubrum extorquens]
MMERQAPMIMNIIKQGGRARTTGRPKDACPYPADSRERRAWFEGYDGSTWELSTRDPHPSVAFRGVPVRPDAATVSNQAAAAT